MLALADGMTYEQIKTQLRTTAPTIARWKRFEKDRLNGLEARHIGSKPRAAAANVQARVARKTTQPPTDGSTHWSCRKMAVATGLSKSMIERMWAQARLKPHRLDSYLAGNDPQFEQKAKDVIGLYLNLPQHTAVFCVDEKTAIQALDRLDSVLPLSPGRTKWAKEIHIVLDNLSAHKIKDVQRFLMDNPQVRFHFTPTYSSWLNQVELWLAKIQQDVLSRGVFTSVADLGNKLRKYIRACSKSSRPFRWTYSDPNRRIRANRIGGTAY